MPLPFAIDWKNPDYRMVLEYRIDKLKTIRSDRDKWMPKLNRFYRDNPAQFIIDWGITYDPRNEGTKLPKVLPFLLFPRQEEMIHELMDCWFKGEDLYVEKTREMGASWVTLATACTLCNFRNNITIGFASREADLVDRADDPDSLFWKARQFMIGLPAEFVGGWKPDKRSKARPWNPYKDAPQFRIKFPHTNSVMLGETGREIGRGGRATFYVVDEAAFLPEPFKAEASLSRTTNCRIYVSTPNGLNNPFAQSVKSGTKRVFTYHWTQDPRKDLAWYENEKKKFNALVIARELDINYASSIEGMVIPAEWFEASIDAHVKLAIEITGKREAGFDVADEGSDKNCFAGRHGILLQHLEEWSGVGSDIYRSVEKVFGLCDRYGYDSFTYDADGLGAGVRGDARTINERRVALHLPSIGHKSFQGSGKVWKPEAPVILGTDAIMRGKRTNKDYYANLKAQCWWALRLRFQATYRAIVEKLPFNPHDIISIDSRLKGLSTLRMQMQQPTWDLNGTGHILIDKMPDGMKSPNQADAVMICYNPAMSAADAWAKMALAGR